MVQTIKRQKLRRLRDHIAEVTASGTRCDSHEEVEKLALDLLGVAIRLSQKVPEETGDKGKSVENVEHGMSNDGWREGIADREAIDLAVSVTTFCGIGNSIAATISREEAFDKLVDISEEMMAAIGHPLPDTNYPRKAILKMIENASTSLSTDVQIDSFLAMLFSRSKEEVKTWLPQPETTISAVYNMEGKLLSSLLEFSDVEHIQLAAKQATFTNQSIPLAKIFGSKFRPTFTAPLLIGMLQSSIRLAHLQVAKEILKIGSYGILWESIGLEHIVFLCHNVSTPEGGDTLEFLLSKNIVKVCGKDPQAQIIPLESESELWGLPTFGMTCMGAHRLRPERLTKRDGLGVATVRAAMKGNIWCLKCLLEFGVDLNWRKGIALKLTTRVLEVTDKDDVGNLQLAVDLLKGAPVGTIFGKVGGFVPGTLKRAITSVGNATGFTLSRRNSGMKVVRLAQPSAVSRSSNPARKDTSANTPDVSGDHRKTVIPVENVGSDQSTENQALREVLPVERSINSEKDVCMHEKDYNSRQTSLQSEALVTTDEKDAMIYERPKKDFTARQMSVQSEAPSSFEHISLVTPDLIRISNATPESLNSCAIADETRQQTFHSYDEKAKSTENEKSFVQVDSRVHLLDLPEKVLFAIAFYLTKRDMAYFTSTCSKLSSMCLSSDFMAAYILYTVGAMKAFQSILQSPESFDKKRLINSLLNIIPEENIQKICYYCIEYHEPNILTLLMPKFKQTSLIAYMLQSIQMRNVDCLRVFLSHPDLDPNVSNGVALTMAVTQGDGAVVDVLLQHGARADANQSAALRALCGVVDTIAENRTETRDATAGANSIDTLSNSVNRANLASKLLLGGASVSANDYEPLKSAALSGNVDLLRVLVKEIVGGSPTSSGPPFVRTRSHSLGNGEETEAKIRDVFRDVFMNAAKVGNAGAFKLLLDDPRTCGNGEANWTQTIICPALLEAISNGWVSVVKAVADSKYWVDIIKVIGGDVLLDKAARYVYIEDESLPISIRDRKRKEMPVIPIDSDIIIPHSAAMAECMLAGVSGNAGARFTAFETRLMKKGIDAYAFLSSTKPAERESPFQKLKDYMLIQSAYLGHETVMDAVISILQPDVAGSVGQSALIAAALKGYTKIVASLFSSGVNYDAVSELAFIVAQDRGHTDTVKYLTVMRDVRVKTKEAAAKKLKVKESEEKLKRASAPLLHSAL